MRWRQPPGRPVRIAAGLCLVILVVGAVVMGSIALRAQPKALAIGQTSWPTVRAEAKRPVAVFIGDSYSVGVGASEPSKRWTTLLAANEGWEEINIARGGTGYLTTAGLAGCGLAFCGNYQQSAKEAITRRPQIVVIAGGQNDQLQDPAAESAAIDATYAAVRHGLPQAKIVAVGPSSPDAAPGQHIQLIDAAVRSAAQSVGAVYVSLLVPPVVAQGMVLPDKTHVDEAGHVAIEQRVATALKNSAQSR